MSWALTWWSGKFCRALASLEQGLYSDAETLCGYGVAVVIKLASLAMLHPPLLYKTIQPFPHRIPLIPRLPSQLETFKAPWTPLRRTILVDTDDKRSRMSLLHTIVEPPYELLVPRRHFTLHTGIEVTIPDNIELVSSALAVVGAM